jgi:hypothetical protein
MDLAQSKESAGGQEFGLGVDDFVQQGGPDPESSSGGRQSQANVE